MKMEASKSKDAIESSREAVLERGGNASKNSVELAMERAEFMEASAKSEEADAKAIADLNKAHNMPPSPAIDQKLAEADEIKAKEAVLLSSVEEKPDLTTAEGRQKKIDKKESDYEKTVREIDNQPKTQAEKNDEEIAKYFGKKESTIVKNYDKDDNEIVEVEKPKTLEEKTQIHAAFESIAFHLDFS